MSKHCNYCNETFELSDTHWRQHTNGRVSCKKKSQDRRKKKRSEKNLEKYGTEDPLSDSGYHIYLQARRIETMRKRYGADNPMQVDEFKARQRASRKPPKGVNLHEKSVILEKNRPKAAAKRANKYGELLSNNLSLQDFCASMGINPEWAYDEYVSGGEEGLANALYGYKINLTNMEGQFAQIVQSLDLECAQRVPVPGTDQISDFHLKSESGELYVKLDSLYWSMMSPEVKSHKRYPKGDKGSSMLHFRAHEVSRKPEVIRSILANRMSNNINKSIKPANYTIYNINNTQASDFLKRNTLAGDHKATKGFGVFADKELVAVFSVRVRERCAYVERVGVKNGYRVKGLLKMVVKWIKKNIDCRTIVAYCDLRYQDPAEYEKVGFEAIKTWIDWEWTNGIDVFPKSRCRAKMDDRLLPERAYAAELGFRKLYDAGKTKFIMINRG